MDLLHHKEYEELFTIVNLKLQHIMATLTALQEQVNNINGSVSSIGTSVTSIETLLSNSISAADSDTLLASITETAGNLAAQASALQNIVTPPTV